VTLDWQSFVNNSGILSPSFDPTLPDSGILLRDEWHIHEFVGDKTYNLVLAELLEEYSMPHSVTCMFQHWVWRVMRFKRELRRRPIWISILNYTLGRRELLLLWRYVIHPAPSVSVKLSPWGSFTSAGSFTSLTESPNYSCADA